MYTRLSCCSFLVCSTSPDTVYCTRLNISNILIFHAFYHTTKYHFHCRFVAADTPLDGLNVCLRATDDMFTIPRESYLFTRPFFQMFGQFSALLRETDRQKPSPIWCCNTISSFMDISNLSVFFLLILVQLKFLKKYLQYLLLG
jgi:hypothetical protein